MGATHSCNSLAQGGLFVVALICSLTLLLSGCGKHDTKVPAVTAMPFQWVEQNGAAALQFTNWTIVFEAIPARSANIGATGVLVFGPGSGSGGNKERGIQFRQFAGKDATIVSVNNYTFKLMKGGRQISFNDHFYEIKQGPKTIVVGKDGKREGKDF
jgi:hypothetical protein